jgi:2-hydroxy-6-oxonona-2,4-dienedioate hydrolase
LAKRLGRIEGRSLRVSGMRLHVRVSPTSPPQAPVVVLVHGIGVASPYMVPTAERLAPFCRVYAPDLPDFGDSEKPAKVFRIEELAVTLAALLGALGHDKAAFIGNSFGCQIAADLAVRHPEKVERLVLQGITVDPEARTAPQQISRWLRDAPHEPPSQGLNVLRDYLKCGTRRLLKTFHYMLEDRIEEKLPKVMAPTLVVRGAKDPIMPQRWAERATRLLPKGELRVIPGAAHTLNYAAPLEFTRVLRPFLENRS